MGGIDIASLVSSGAVLGPAAGFVALVVLLLKAVQSARKEVRESDEGIERERARSRQANDRADKAELDRDAERGSRRRTEDQMNELRAQVATLQRDIQALRARIGQEN